MRQWEDVDMDAGLDCVCRILWRGLCGWRKRETAVAALSSFPVLTLSPCLCLWRVLVCVHLCICVWIVSLSHSLFLCLCLSTCG